MASLSRPVLSAIILLLALAMRLASEPTANVSYLILAAYATMGRAQAIHALAGSWLFTVLSPGLAPAASLASIGRYAVLAGAAASVLLRSGLVRREGVRVDRTVLWTVVLGSAITLHAALFSPIKDVSILKAVSWTVATASLLSAWSGLSMAQRTLVQKQIFWGLFILMLVSLPLLGAGLGYLRNGQGFQGVLNHPQAFGPTMAVLGAWAAGGLLSSRRPSILLMALLGISIALIVLSEARTAGLALLMALAVAVIVIQVLTKKRFAALFPAFTSGRLHVAAGLTLVAMVATAPVLAGVLQDYISKRGATTSVAEAYDRSRGKLIDRMWLNIQEQPWSGIGFGIASDPRSMEISRDPLLGLPVGASIEKGVLPLAILEELGIPGALAVAAWIWMLIRRAVRGLSVVPLALLFTVLLLNMGEMMLFSPGGMGLLMLLLVGFAASERPVYRGREALAHG